jgi:aryl-alcohol dehydrogenase-like predicted oxidoreductase
MSTERRSRLLYGSADLRDDDVTPVLLSRYYDAGGRRLDLANVYGDGESERAIGKWLAGTGLRDELELHVKGCHPPYCDPANVNAEVERARAALGVDRLDSFTLHRDDTQIPVEAFAEVLLAQVEQGRIAAFGVSNWTFARFVELLSALGIDAGKLAIFSNHFSLAEMVVPTWPGTLAMSEDELAALDAAGVTAIAWAALAGGFFAGRDQPSWAAAANLERRTRAEELAGRLGVTTPAVALAYVLAQGPRVWAAVGTRSLAHLNELLAAPALELTPDDLVWLRDG